MCGDETMQVMKQSCCRLDVRDNVFAKSRSNVIRYVTTSFGRSLKHPIVENDQLTNEFFMNRKPFSLR